MTNSPASQSPTAAIHCWFVGAVVDGRDQTDRFIDEGVWEHGFDDDRGEYRTQRLVLEAWDRLLGRQAPGQFGSYGEKAR